MSYLGAVSFEAHGLYGKFAAVGFVLAIVSLFVRDEHVIEQITQEM
jgi:hypothetical protein